MIYKKNNILYRYRLFFNKKTMQSIKMKVIFTVLLLSLFASVSAVDLWDVKYDEATGNAAYWDMKANDNDLSAWSGINVTDKKSSYWNLEADWAAYDAAWNENGKAVSNGTTNNTVTPATSNNNATDIKSTKMDNLPQTWPKEMLLLVFALIIVWLFFVKRRKTI